jgi:hypothetical protein
MMRFVGLLASIATLGFCTSAQEILPDEGEGDADVLFVKAVETAAGLWTFHVTVSHADTGWEDYADGWDVVLPDRTVVLPGEESLFTRLLLHPHVEEQPFTRSQSGIKIPRSTTTVFVRAHDRRDGFGGKQVRVELFGAAGDDFEVHRLD